MGLPLSITVDGGACVDQSVDCGSGCGVLSLRSFSNGPERTRPALLVSFEMSAGMRQLVSRGLIPSQGLIADVGQSRSELMVV